MWGSWRTDWKYTKTSFFFPRRTHCFCVRARHLSFYPTLPLIRQIRARQSLRKTTTCILLIRIAGKSFWFFLSFMKSGSSSSSFSDGRWLKASGASPSPAPGTDHRVSNQSQDRAPRTPKCEEQHFFSSLFDALWRWVGKQRRKAGPGSSLNTQETVDETKVSKAHLFF